MTMKPTTMTRLTQKLVSDLAFHPFRQEILSLMEQQLIDDVHGDTIPPSNSEAYCNGSAHLTGCPSFL